MRLVRGTVVSWKPCSLSKTSRILRRFIKGDAGADPSVINYVKRAAEDVELSLTIEKSGVKHKHRNGHSDFEEITSLKTKKKKHRKSSPEAVAASSEGFSGSKIECADDSAPSKRHKKRHKSEEENVENRERSDPTEAAILDKKKSKKRLDENGALTSIVAADDGCVKTEGELDSKKKKRHRLEDSEDRGKAETEETHERHQRKKKRREARVQDT
eukprot:TRINITY_DN5047_c0_g2_i1.p1 TRINITY_DN5047_c0_g2~~TRINITY_DN5047_c0_g2_i1.p1  ORF type:complete len:215 (+),score=34.26 TRINITY_DN5047_c0_g2_i1:210-854(+)